MDEKPNPYESPRAETPKARWLRENAFGVFAMTGAAGLAVIGFGLSKLPNVDMLIFYAAVGTPLCLLAAVGALMHALEKRKRR